MASRLIARRSAFSRLLVRGGHGDHHGPNMPPFARLAPPSTKLPLEVELVWNDGVAPETAIDFDAPNVPLSTVLMSFACAFGFFGMVYGLIALNDPETKNPVSRRDYPFSYMKELGFDEVVKEEEH